ncbi:MAG: DUF4388 domain-containing protein [Acidobacteria bacterium]|nr:DUF4388 domain-containing protein [Acidobacteriota bacterium]
MREALTELGQYLSDSLPPLMVADSLTVLTRVPSHQVAAEIASWASGQQSAGGLPLTDYYYHGLRKVQLVGEFRLVPPSLFDPFFAKLKNTILEGVPSSDRDRLAADLAHLSEGRSVSVEKVEVLHRPAGADDSPPEAAGAPGASRGASGAPQGVRLNLPPGFDLNPQALRRLEVLLKRLGPLAAATTPERRDVVAAEAFATVAAGASSSHEMDAQLAEFNSAGLAYGTYELFRALGENLPGWWAPGLADTTDGTDPGLAAMERLVTLAEDRVEASRRFREMIENAIEQFNSGALGRAVKMFDLALKMIERGEVLAESVESLRERGHEALDPESIAELVKEDNPQGFPRVVLRFFPALSPERLLDELRREQRRDRRQTLLSLIETHGDDGREAVFDRLVHRPDELAEVYLFRNLVHLLRRIPRSVNTTWPQEHEIARIIRFLVPERPLLLIKEIVAYLSSANHPVADQALRSFLARLEAMEASADTPDEERAHLRFRLDATCRALAASDDPQAWEALVEHALSPNAEPADALRRLRALGRRDLSTAPELVNRLIDVALEKVGDCAAERRDPDQGKLLAAAISALASTRTPQVRALLETVAKRLPDDVSGDEAARQLRELDAAPGNASVVPEGSLLGDLGLFALPALLQSLADLGSTGTITFTDRKEEVVARVTLENGMVIEARAGDITGSPAVWQLMERPFAGHFSFVPDAGVAAPDAAEPCEVTALLLEGMKRGDELRLAEALVPGDVPLVAMVESPPPVPDEDDPGLTQGLWATLAAGRTVNECERALAVDAFRVWRAAAAWVEAGALEPAMAPAQGEPSGSSSAFETPAAGA